MEDDELRRRLPELLITWMTLVALGLLTTFTLSAFRLELLREAPTGTAFAAIAVASANIAAVLAVINARLRRPRRERPQIGSSAQRADGVRTKRIETRDIRPGRPETIETPRPDVVDPPERAHDWTGVRLPLVVAAVAASAAVAQGVLARSGPPPPDCVAYAAELRELADAFQPAQLDAALEVLEFDRYEEACGDAGTILKRLTG